MMLTTSSISSFRLTLQQDLQELRESFRIFDRNSHGYLTWEVWLPHLCYRSLSSDGRLYIDRIFLPLSR